MAAVLCPFSFLFFEGGEGGKGVPFLIVPKGKVCRNLKHCLQILHLEGSIKNTTFLS